MSYTVENVNGCTKKIVFNFENLELSSEIKAAVLNKQKDVTLKGFRKGKAPLSMVEQIYGPKIEQDAVNTFIQAKFFDALTKENIRMVGHPAFENLNYVPGQKISFDALVEFYPEVTVSDMSSLKFEKEKIAVTEEDIENVKKDYLSSKAEMKEVEDENRTLENGLHAVFNFEGVKEDGTSPDEMKAQDYVLEIGSGQFIPGFEEGMIGMKKGDKRDIPLSFPEDYHAEELQNAKVTFKVELLEIKENKLPEFTEEMAKEFGFESIEDFNEKNKKNLTHQRERSSDEKLHQAILEKLVEENAFDVPKALVLQQEEHLKQDLAGDLKRKGFSEEMLGQYFEKWAGDLTTKAEFQVKSGLILDSLAKKYEVKVEESDLEEKLKSMAEMSGLDLDQIKKYYTSNETMKNNLRYALREEKTFGKIKEEVKVDLV